jgi:hypothetical protein
LPLAGFRLEGLEGSHDEDIPELLEPQMQLLSVLYRAVRKLCHSEVLVFDLLFEAKPLLKIKRRPGCCLI